VDNKLGSRRFAECAHHKVGSSRMVNWQTNGRRLLSFCRNCKDLTGRATRRGADPQCPSDLRISLRQFPCHSSCFRNCCFYCSKEIHNYPPKEVRDLLVDSGRLVNRNDPETVSIRYVDACAALRRVLRESCSSIFLSSSTLMILKTLQSMYRHTDFLQTISLSSQPNPVFLSV
jgi:hypothetical protein